jgi:hypothetical protein
VVRGPHRSAAGNRSAASARLNADIEDHADPEYDEWDESSDEDDDDEANESSEDFDSDDVVSDDADSDEAPQESEDDRYAHINPALMARLRAKRMRDRQQRLRRSA